MKKILWVVLLVIVVSCPVFAGKPIPQAIDTTGSKIFDDLEWEMEGFDKDAKFDVIVVLNEEFNLKSIESSIGEFDLKHSYQYINAFAGTLNKGQITDLSKMSMVSFIQKDGEATVLNNDAIYWGGAQAARSYYGVDGSGIGIAIIDTGICGIHTDMPNIVAFKDFVNNQIFPYDDNGHGTHCAGIVAGTGASARSLRGVAPGANLIGIKVLNAQGTGSISNINRGIEWAIANKNLYNIRVINLAVTTSTNPSGNDSTSLLCNAAVDNGIVVVVAAGNSGSNRGTIGSPASSPKVITVGAAQDVGEGGWLLAPFSSRGGSGWIKPDIVAPGVNITSAKSGTNNQYSTFSGTSMAASYVSGTVALMLQYNPFMTPNHVKNRLYTSSIINNHDLGQVGTDIDWGRGLIDTYKAINGASTSPVPQPDLVTYRSYLNQHEYHDYSFDVTNTDYPIAITMITTNPTYLYVGSSVWINPDLDVYLYGPNEVLVAKAVGSARQETISFRPLERGTYRIRVMSSSGAGNYTLDISFK